MNREQYISILEVEKAELKKENQQLKEQLENERLDYEIAIGHNKELRNIQKEQNKQLKQRDEVIDEAIKYIEQNDNSELGIYQDKFLGKYELLEILQKYKGDNNE